jgi:6-phosphogluconolactonase
VTTSGLEAAYVYVGTYTEADRGGRGEGIYVYRMDPASGDLTQVQTLAGVPNPHFLALHPNRRFLYSTNGGDTSAVTAYQIDGANGRLSQLNRQLSPGPGPTHLAVDPSGRCVVVANYAGGSVAVYPVEADGKLAPHSDFHQHAGPLGPNAKRQDKPHAHMAGFDRSGRWVLICDLGMDRTFVYRVDTAAGKIAPNDPAYGAAPAGHGPRHLAFHPNGRWVYVINELAGSITAFAFDDQTGALSALQTISTLPAGFDGENISAEVVVHPNGRFVYGSNRGDDSLAIFEVDGADGTLTAIGHVKTGGQTPRHFDIEASGQLLYAANQDSDNVVVFRVDASTGQLTPTGHVTQVGTPSCVVFKTA